MTDLRKVPASAVSTDRTIEDCNALMKARAIRLLFVEDAQRRVLGVITATDLLGEKPVRFMQERGLRRHEILASDLMTPRIRPRGARPAGRRGRAGGPHRGHAQGRRAPAHVRHRRRRQAHLRPVLRDAHRPAPRHRRDHPRGRHQLRPDRGRPGAMTDGHAQAVRDFRWQVPARFNIAAVGLPPLGRRPRPPRPVLGGRVGRHRRVHLLGPARRPPTACRTRSRRWAWRAASASRSSCPSARRRSSPTSRASRWARSRCRCRYLFGPDALEYRLADSGAKVAIVDPTRCPTCGPLRERLPALAHVIGVAGAREAGVHAWEGAAREGLAPLRVRRHRPARSGRHHLHERHHGPAQGRAHAAVGPPRATSRASSTRTTASRRPGDLFWSPADWAWTGGLWDALMPTLLPRAGHPRLPRPLRPGARLPPARQVRGAERLPLPHGAQDDAEGRGPAARALRPGPALADERRRGRWGRRCSTGAARSWASR